MLKKLRKAIAKALPGDSEKYLGTVLALATGNPLYAGIGALADPDAGFGEVATAAFLASQSPGIKGLSGGIGTPKDASKLTFFEKFLGQGKPGAGSFGEFFLGKKGLEGAAGTPGLFGSDGSLIPTKMVDGTEKIDAAKLLSRLSMASSIGGATLAPTGIFDIPEQEEPDFTFPGSDYQATALNLTPGQLIDLQIGGGIVGPYYSMQGDLIRNVADGGFMQEQTNGLKDIEKTMMMAQGGTTEFPRKTGEISGPGTGTSDSIPAMLSDGEFVMTADAVKGAGEGDRIKGARRMYQMMDQLEAKV